MSNSDIAAAIARWMATTIDGENKHEWHRDMHAAIVALRAAQEWQDISTAPKDGRDSFLVRFRSGHVEHVYVTVPPLTQTYRYCGGPMSGKQAGWPDHWMPLPAPPVAVIADDRGTK